jgi:hypothetical protein
MPDKKAPPPATKPVSGGSKANPTPATPVKGAPPNTKKK